MDTKTLSVQTSEHDDIDIVKMFQGAHTTNRQEGSSSMLSDDVEAVVSKASAGCIWKAWTSTYCSTVIHQCIGQYRIEKLAGDAKKGFTFRSKAVSRLPIDNK